VRVRVGSSVAALTIAFGIANLCPANCSAQSSAGAETSTAQGATASVAMNGSLDGSATPPKRTADSIKSAKASSDREAGKVGVSVGVSSLGAGLEVGVSVARKVNIRGGFNDFSYSREFGKDGITYNGNLRLRSGSVLLDWFPFGGGFHLSPGALVYNGNRGTANANVPGGQTFTLGGTTYQSDTANPVTGKGNLGFTKAAPMVLFGWGNLVPRHKHFIFKIETGVVFQGSPRTTLALAGSACQPGGGSSVNAATNPGVQGSVQAEQIKLNNTLSPFKYYPVISIATGYRF
jgi:hypothetical protein